MFFFFCWLNLVDIKQVSLTLDKINLSKNSFLRDGV